jgi:hypothetical protein
VILTIIGLGCSAPEPSHPNVVLITVDTLRADRLGAYGFELDTSPAIDRLAAHGTLFERAIAGASFTSASHASIMTSRYTREHTIGYLNGGTRLEGIPTLAEILNHAATKRLLSSETSSWTTAAGSIAVSSNTTTSCPMPS